MPIARATLSAPCSSPVASAGETAVTASALSPSARAASAATSEESTPPEKATIALPRSAMRASSRSTTELLPRRGGRRVPDGAGRLTRFRSHRRAVVVLGRHVEGAAVEAADLHAHVAAGHLHRSPFALELPAADATHAHAERAAVREHRLGHRLLIGGLRKRRQHDARPALLHLRGRDPHV